MTSIHELLDQFRKAGTSNREMGDRFERLMLAYLTTDPLYKDKYSEVWLWQDWPERDGKVDTGIDLVAKDPLTDGYCAIQCKFNDPDHTLQKGDIDSFFTASGKAPFTSRLIISTTDKWSQHAEDALRDQHIPVARLRAQDLADSPIDWSQFSIAKPQDIVLKTKKQLRDHQQKALDKVIAGFREYDRGKLIMACGTGKTFTSLKIAETLVKDQGLVLFLVPSISLLSQSLREWTSESVIPLYNFAVCSDRKVGKKKENEDISVHDLAFPATTDARKLVLQVEAFRGKRPLTVIFSTYQSIQVVSDAQAQGLPAFDLIVCDEAHRTTGMTIDGEEESHFVRVHRQDFIRANKRLYMTATPRIYADNAKTKAEENNGELCSMDDVSLYGPEFHRLSFSEAVGSGLLSDYKVMVLAVDEKFVSKAFQRQLAEVELKLDDAVKITGCWNGLSKRMADGTSSDHMAIDPNPMHRAVAFSRSIKDSQRFADLFGQIIAQYTDQDDSALHCEVAHVDGTFNVLKRNNKIDWLKEDTSRLGNICRILSNARCLSEGVDVPALDAVMFLNPRNSEVDVVQSVGRVMRKAEGKKYGYIILPIGIPADLSPEEALKDNDKYKIVWQVLQALRAHDDRFNAIINKIELNTTRPDKIQVIGVGGGEDSADPDNAGNSIPKPVQTSLAFPHLEEWRDAIYAKIVLKCGDRRYLESWAKDVAQIADRHMTRIKALLESADPQHRQAFAEFLQGLQDNLNPSIQVDDAIEMLSQHLITRPVFDALFEGYQFTKLNPVSITMQRMLDLMDDHALEEETISLDKFYNNVRERVDGIKTTEGKQKVIVELYDKFFRTAFPRMAERLGIVYTPVEVVDFIIRSVHHALQQEFGVGLGDKGVHVLDPFTGTGTFLVRLLQSGLIPTDQLPYKFQEELHANELILLAYYIAAINIEEAYHGLVPGAYQPFEGIVLTDTFQMGEEKGTLTEKMFPENNKRVVRQNRADIRVIIGNPPYSAGQSSENDVNKNIKYPHLDSTIRETYVKHSNATLKKNLYDSYIRAIRWATDRIKDKGIINFVINGSFIDANNMDGIRQCLLEDFTDIYCFNLRGNQKKSDWKREGGKIFGEGSQATITIILLIKNPDKKGENQLYYYDIGDFKSREDKLEIVSTFKSFENIPWQKIYPNSSHDWIKQRDPSFMIFPSLAESDERNEAFFTIYSNGLLTSRDKWAYNFNPASLKDNMSLTIDFYNQQLIKYKEHRNTASKKEAIGLDKFLDNDHKKISWSRRVKKNLEKSNQQVFKPTAIRISWYRPYCKQWVYFDNIFNEEVYKLSKIFPLTESDNLYINIDGRGSTKPFSVIISNILPDYELISKGQSFPLYYYDNTEGTNNLFTKTSDGDHERNHNIRDAMLKVFQQHYGTGILKEDIFYYVYGLLHSSEYRQRFENDLKKMSPRIPLAKDFWVFSKAGRGLAEWHLHYEKVEPYLLEEVQTRLSLDPSTDFKVQKMSFGKTGGKEDKSSVIYNSNLTLRGIPLEAYDYIVNGKPAIEWIMERYQWSQDKDSLIVNDPNDWSEDPRYIIDLLKRIVRVSMETMKIVNALPALEELI